MDGIEQAAEALDGFANGAASDAAEALADVFEQAGNRIADSLERAAKSGELSFNNLAESVLSDLARLAVSELITAPLESAVSSLSSSLALSAAGGTVSKSAPVTVNLTMTNASGKTSVAPASSAQMASQIAQAVSRAQNRT